jgi:hypothetical protein
VAEYEFALVIHGPVEDDEVVNALFEHGCDDATLGTIDGVGHAGFHREAASLGDAVFSAIKDVESVPGLPVLQVEHDDLVALSEIPSRLWSNAGERSPSCCWRAGRR